MIYFIFCLQIGMNGPRLALFQKLSDRGLLLGPGGSPSIARCSAAAAAVGMMSGLMASPLYMVREE